MFNLVRTTPMPEYDGQALYYVHDTTGMEVFHVKNKDKEMTCSFIFSTPSEDSKGFAHVLEHTVLCGSKRYQVKDPFSQVLLSSPNTFLNAITFCDKTMYPFSTPLKKDFDIIFDIYADAVFAPLLRKQSFLQEGIRSFDGRFDGVVFNEMCGARSTEEAVVQFYSTKDLYKGTPYQYDSGGDPVCITELTYEEYLKRYDKWYSPSNCRLFLFGDINAKEYLDKLEERYLKNSKKGEKIIPKSENYLQKSLKPMRNKAFCPAGDSNSVLLTWLTEEADNPFNVLAVSTLVDILLGNSGAPLYRAITESDLGEDLNPVSGTDVEGPVLTFSVGFSHALKDKEDEIEAFFIEQFEKYVKEGLPKEAVQAAIKRAEFRIQEIQGDGLPFGIATCLKAARTWLRGKRPEDGIMGSHWLSVLKEKLEKGRFFEDWIQKNILENQRRCLTVVTSSDKYEEIFQNELAAKLEKVKAYSKEEKAEFEEFINNEDSDEALASIERITIADLPRHIPDYRHDVFKINGNVKHYDYRLFTRGIVYLSILFDVRNLSLEQKKLLPLLVRAMQMCGTKEHDFTQIGNTLRLLTGNFYMYPSAGSDVKGNPISSVVLKAKMLHSDLEPAFDVIAEILTEVKLDDSARIKAAITDLITEFESGYPYSANAFAAMNASSVYSASAYESELFMGTELWLYMNSLKEDLDNNKTSYESLSASLTSLFNKVFTQKAMTIHTGCDNEVSNLNQILTVFINKFKVGKFVRKTNYYKNFSYFKEIGSPDKPVVMTLPSGPAFNALVFRAPVDSEKKYVAVNLLSSILSSGYLWNVVRGCNGAYGVECHLDTMEKLLVFSSYRDPEIKKTLEIFLESLRQEVDPAEIEYAVVTTIGKELRPLTPQASCNEAFNRILYGKSTALYLRRRKLLLGLTKQDLEEIAQELIEESKNCSVTVVCGAEHEKNLKSIRSIALPL